MKHEQVLGGCSDSVLSSMTDNWLNSQYFGPGLALIKTAERDMIPAWNDTLMDWRNSPSHVHTKQL